MKKQLTGDAMFYRAWSSGLSVSHAAFLANMVDLPEGEYADAFIRAILRGVSLHRTPSRMRRYIVRNRRAYHHDQALIARHEREVLRARDGMRCHQCRAVPPQPGEIMDPESIEYIASLT